MKKKTFFLALLFLGAMMTFAACGRNASSSENNAGDTSSNGEEILNEQEETLTNLDGSTWVEVDAINRTRINCWEREHYPCMRRLYYFRFINDNKVEITRREVPYRMDGEVKLLDSMVCDYKYDYLNGTISCSQSSKCTFNISQLQNGHSCHPDAIYYMEIYNFGDKKERLTLFKDVDDVSFKELLKLLKNKVNN